MTGPFDSMPTRPAVADRRCALPCPECCGEGVVEVHGGPGYFDEYEECWMPSGANVEPCSACRATGVQEPDETEEELTDADPRGVTSHDAEDAEPALPF